jgi:hypothetical protein
MGGGGMVKPGSGSPAKALQASDDRMRIETANQKIRWWDIVPSWIMINFGLSPQKK